jgi:hypothetical protein
MNLFQKEKIGVDIGQRLCYNGYLLHRSFCVGKCKKYDGNEEPDSIFLRITLTEGTITDNEEIQGMAI